MRALVRCGSLMDPSPIQRIASGGALMALIGVTSSSRQRVRTNRRVLMLIIRAMLPRRQGTEPEYWRARWRRRDPRDRNAESIGIAPRVSLVHKVSSALGPRLGAHFRRSSAWPPA